MHIFTQKSLQNEFSNLSLLWLMPWFNQILFSNTVVLFLSFSKLWKSAKSVYCNFSGNFDQYYISVHQRERIKKKVRCMATFCFVLFGFCQFALNWIIYRAILHGSICELIICVPCFPKFKRTSLEVFYSYDEMTEYELWFSVLLNRNQRLEKSFTLLNFE